jgi:hypothetical protein
VSIQKVSAIFNEKLIVGVLARYMHFNHDYESNFGSFNITPTLAKRVAMS